MRPAVRRDVVGVLQGTYQISQRRACSAMGFGRSSHRCRSRRDPQVALRLRLRDLAAVRVRYGCRRLHVLLRREGRAVNHKRVHRLCTGEGLSIRTKLPRCKRAWRYRQGRPGAEAANEVWAMDFMSDPAANPFRNFGELFNGRPIRILTVVDIHTRKALSTAPRANFRAAQVVEVLDQLVRARGKPRSLRVDSGPEFAGRLLDHWACLNKVEIDFSRPGKPTDNAPEMGARPSLVSRTPRMRIQPAAPCGSQARCRTFPSRLTAPASLHCVFRLHETALASMTASFVIRMTSRAYGVHAIASRRRRDSPGSRSRCRIQRRPDVLLRFARVARLHLEQ